jgi:hypothetical protein
MFFSQHESGGAGYSSRRFARPGVCGVQTARQTKAARKISAPPKLSTISYY